MGKPYSDDLRERVVAAIEAGHTRVKVAELYDMALSTVGGFIKRKRRRSDQMRPRMGRGENTIAPGPRRKSISAAVHHVFWPRVRSGSCVTSIAGPHGAA